MKNKKNKFFVSPKPQEFKILDGCQSQRTLKSKIYGDKKGLSIIVGYVLLIVIGISLSLLVYAWLKNYVPREGVKCPDNAGIAVSSYNCSDDVLELTLKNTGFFSLDGYILRIKTSNGMHNLPADNNIENFFNNTLGLKPNGQETWVFDYSTYTDILEIEIQPFIFDKELVMCEKAVIKQAVQNCD